MKNRIVRVFILLNLCGCAAITPHDLENCRSSQAILVTPIRPDSHQAYLSVWQKQTNAWHRVYRFSAVIGRHGMAAPGVKREGDGMTPSGIYTLGPAFGYAPSIVTGLEYRQAGNLDFWVDDVKSLQYNQWVRGLPAANSFEHLRRADDLYRYGVVIGYNMHPVVIGAGSAIFMHIWRRYDSPTAGCVALSGRNLRKTLRWLNRFDQPVIILEPSTCPTPKH